MALIDENIKNQLRKDFEEKLQNSVRIIYVKGKECKYCNEIHEIIKTLEEVSNGKIMVEEYDFDNAQDIIKRYNIERYPALILVSELHSKGNIKFYGAPSGYEFMSLVEDIHMLSTGHTSVSEESKKILADIKKPVKIQVFVTPTCPYCPRAVLTAHQLAMENQNIESEMIEAIEFDELSRRYNVMAVPKIVINEGVVSFEGALPEPYFVQKIIEAVNK